MPKLLIASKKPLPVLYEIQIAYDETNPTVSSRIILKLVYLNKVCRSLE